MTFQKGVKFRIYPNREQRNLIDRTLGCSRLIYNKGLAMREDAFKSGGEVWLQANFCYADSAQAGCKLRIS